MRPSPTTRTEPRARLDLGGTNWHIIRPPASDIARLVVINDRLDMAWLTRFLVAHAHPDERDDFALALQSEPSIDGEWLIELVRNLSAVVYAGLPLGALLALWGLWGERSYVIHGRLLLAGSPEGAEALDTYDVACLMWAQIEVERGIHHPFAKPDEARKAAQALRDELMAMDARSGAPRSEVDEFRALLERNAPAERRKVVPATGSTEADVIDFRDALNRSSPDPSPETPDDDA